MTRSVPRCRWTDAIVLDNRAQARVSSTIMARGVTGFHSRSSKANFLSWVSRQAYSHVWHVEDDAYLHQAHPRDVAMRFANSSADLVAVPLQRQVGGWVERQCTVCNRTNVVKFAWPIVRLSRRLAREVERWVERRGAHGHHEVLIGTLCAQLEWCRTDLRHTHPFVGHIGTSGGGATKTYLPETTELVPGHVYHPWRCAPGVRAQRT
jgi:hypothetical protein